MGGARIPLIKESNRARFQEHIKLLADLIKDENERVEPGSLDKNASYAIYALVKELYDLSVVNDFIRAMGVLEETKLCLYTLEILPLEQKILAKRWYAGDAK